MKNPENEELEDNEELIDTPEVCLFCGFPTYDCRCLDEDDEEIEED